MFDEFGFETVGNSDFFCTKIRSKLMVVTPQALGSSYPVVCKSIKKAEVLFLEEDLEVSVDFFSCPI